jgi:hypothetical protein
MIPAGQFLPTAGPVGCAPGGDQDTPALAAPGAPTLIRSDTDG